ncbi:ATP-dependent RNA helicase RhlE [Nitrosomonas cryotolerans]|uniref:DEAD-box ATP-dependent RNA helicase RhpA n=1 Tax=Nitrosomonas cryotolerans ATCC 49181 TaxID=1131553 RepID=A0A1N6FQ20_9PROT|nr:DEAD/DEAH box helicase [Nitrosomonas cryotolerans]SFP94535.1 ATP-dependent RNA helicase RhlE [Nitrosomonas cryotolerans]SIN97369.1 ATP-dependent RNA helicase RhlE [Nitrosomonas cryotolerans ATCC 49181]
MLFEQLGLSTEILRAISEQGYTEPTPIQTQAIPAILAGKDIMGGAQTGTGKTAGFTLPMLRRLQSHANTSMSPARHSTRALILVPTRELAAQVYESVRIYGKYLTLRSAVIYGGVNMDQQIEEIRAGVEILVATPGRLLDHIEQKTLNLAKVDMLIIDEADRMLDMGFLPDVKRIFQQLPEQRQNLMFSATFSDEIKKLADKLLRQPVLIEVAKRNTVSELITHTVYPVNQECKRELLVQLIKQRDLQQVLVFVRTKHGANRLVQQLDRNGVNATAIHGDKNQLQRTQALADFKQGIVRILVATDIAARGLDIEDLSHVINFELPNNPEDYVHRIGRTGRAGTKGNAISLVSEEENQLLIGIEKLLKIKLSVETIDGFEQKNSRNLVPSAGNSHADKPPHERNKIIQKKIRTSRHGDETRSAVRSNVNKTQQPRARYLSAQEDPLFTQPYVPLVKNTISTESNQSDMEKKIMNTTRYGRHKRPLPALFIPPAVDKRK